MNLNENAAFTWRIQRVRRDRYESVDTWVVIEEPLEIVVNGKPIAVLMRMPGREKELAAGFCISEGYPVPFKCIKYELCRALCFLLRADRCGIG